MSEGKRRPVTVRRQWLLDWLGQNGRSPARDIAAAIHTVPRNAQCLLRQLHDEGRVHVAAWRRSTGEGQRGRQYLRLWDVGPGPDAPRPQPDDPVTIRRRRLARVKARYGDDYLKVLASRTNGGVSVLMRDGVVMYRRGKVAGRRQTAAK